jgi:stearoyl-CoA desaturase (delta-9 desaturase)
VRWYQWDPTKWLIATLGFLGLAADLRKTPKAVIVTSRLKMNLGKAEERLARAPEALAAEIRVQMERARHAVDRAVEAWHSVDVKRRELVERGRTRSSDLAKAWRKELRESRQSLADARREWLLAARMLSRLPELS